MYILYSCNHYLDCDQPYKNAVAKFSKLKYLQNYVDEVTLEKFPNGNRRFRRDSLLGCAGYYEWEEEKVIELPINPASPKTPPGIEYILTIEGGYRILCRDKKELEEELKRYDNKGKVEVRQI